MKIAIVGSTGFIGSAVFTELQLTGHEVFAVRAPRVEPSAADTQSNIPEHQIDELKLLLAGADVVINCAGNPDASETDEKALFASNAISPAIVARATYQAGVDRLIHVSSAVVQGRRAVLDQSEETEAFSPYARSKVKGEQAVRNEFPTAVIYRPPSVHARNRRVTLMTRRIARSPLATVAAPGTQPSPQTLIGNVASAISHIATWPTTPPPVVIHPWEGLAVVDVMRVLGGKDPVILPNKLARLICNGLKTFGKLSAPIAANARRVEMLWFGQRQGDSWLAETGWEPPLGRDAWRSLFDDE
ncbi:nucleoside-diphosphate-sugar epimerase [Dietzia cinnamea P4]|nr:nucleoside-diphosphate-sugar epimerase [Dietzia cinnamea P4]